MRKGDKGITKLGSTLLAIDELVAMLEIAKDRVDVQNVFVSNKPIASILEDVQENFSVLQAQLTGASISIKKEKIEQLNSYIDSIELLLPKTETFSPVVEAEGAVYFDACRTVSQKIEHAMLKAKEAGTSIPENSLMYVNRISSLMHVLARLFNHFSGITETQPDNK